MCDSDGVLEDHKDISVGDFRFPVYSECRDKESGLEMNSKTMSGSSVC